MKRNEFIKKIDDLGYYFEVNDNWVIVYDEDGIITRVNEYSVNILDTYWNRDVPTKLFDLCVEYAKTPIQEREDKKKYYLYNPVRDDYFNYHKADKYYAWASQYQIDTIQTEFTEEEIKNNKFNDIMELLTKVEVE